MSKEALVYVRHMLDAIKTIETYTKGMGREAFLKNKMVQDGEPLAGIKSGFDEDR